MWSTTYGNEFWRDFDRIEPKQMTISSSGREFDVILEREGDMWISYVPRLDGLSTYGETRDEVIAFTKEAIRGYLKALEKEKLPVPEAVKVNPAPGQEKIRLPVQISAA